MNIKILRTTLLSISLLSLNLSAAGQMKCDANGFCMVDIKKPSPRIEKIEVKKDIYEYKTIMLNNIETIVFSPEKYLMTEDELGEHDLEQMKMLNNLSMLVLNDESLIFGCEDDLKPVQVVGIENTYECA